MELTVSIGLIGGYVDGNLYMFFRLKLTISSSQVILLKISGWRYEYRTIAVITSLIPSKFV